MKNVKCTKILENIFRLLTNQTADDLAQMKITKNVQVDLLKVSSIVLIVIWLQSASILTKAFSGILLKSYFNLKPYPVVSTLEDLYDNKHLGIVADTRISDLLDVLEYPEEMKKYLNISILKLHKKLDELKIDIRFHFISTEIFNEMVNGKAVLLSFTNVVRGYQDQFSRWSKWFTVSEHRYLNSFDVFLVSKRHVLNQFIKYM